MQSWDTRRKKIRNRIAISVVLTFVVFSMVFSYVPYDQKNEDYYFGNIQLNELFVIESDYFVGETYEFILDIDEYSNLENYYLFIVDIEYIEGYFNRQVDFSETHQIPIEEDRMYFDLANIQETKDSFDSIKITLSVVVNHQTSSDVIETIEGYIQVRSTNGAYMNDSVSASITLLAILLVIGFTVESQIVTQLKTKELQQRDQTNEMVGIYESITGEKQDIDSLNRIDAKKEVEKIKTDAEIDMRKQKSHS